MTKSQAVPIDADLYADKMLDNITGAGFVYIFLIIYI